MEVCQLKTNWWIVVLLTLVIGFFIGIAVKQLTTPNEYSTAEMTAQVERVYSAKVQSLVEQKDQFVASFEKDKSIYEVKLNPVTGQFSDLLLVHRATEQVVTEPSTPEKPLEENEPPQQSTNPNSPASKPNTEVKPKPEVKPTPEVKPKPETKPKPAPKPLLSEQQAINIALKEVSGELDSVDFENTSDGGHYFVEIEQEDDEVTVQVHAITGKILSIQYEE